MATEIKLPRLGQGMDSGTIVKWLKSEGDEVKKGEPLYELDTDKVTQEVEADASGVLLKIAVGEGSEAEVGKTIAVIGEAGEKVDVAQRAEVKQEEKPERKREQPAQVTELRQPSTADGRVKASPLARRMARERGIDLAQIRGTGPEGRVVADDVERAATGPPAPTRAAPAAAEIEVKPLSSIQKTVARRTTEAWQIPVFHLFVSADMTRALDIRRRLVELNAGSGVKPTISDLLTKVCAVALMRHRELNALWGEDGIAFHPNANIGLAVALPEGLVAPVIRECERLSIAEIASARTDLVERARAGKLQRDDLEGGTFTISNLGMYGVERFTAVINPPQAAILAVGAIQEKPVAREGEIVIRPMMDLMLTCDHRSVNGAAGAGFLQTVQSILEEPGLAL